jgi:hypothetical protein
VEHIDAQRFILMPDLADPFVCPNHELMKPERVRRHLRDPVSVLLVGADHILKS